MSSDTVRYMIVQQVRINQLGQDLEAAVKRIEELEQMIRRRDDRIEQLKSALILASDHAAMTPDEFAFFYSQGPGPVAYSEVVSHLRNVICAAPTPI